jgi:hypothetical protein
MSASKPRIEVKKVRRESKSVMCWEELNRYINEARGDPEDVTLLMSTFPGVDVISVSVIL